MRRFVRQAPILSVLLVLAVLAAGVFAVRLSVSALRWADPPAAEDVPEGWMTPRYVVQRWGLDPGAVAEALDLPRDGTGRRVTLEDLAEERGVPVADLVAALERAIRMAAE